MTPPCWLQVPQGSTRDSMSHNNDKAKVLGKGCAASFLSHVHLWYRKTDTLKTNKYDITLPQWAPSHLDSCFVSSSGDFTMFY